MEFALRVQSYLGVVGSLFRLTNDFGCEDRKSGEVVWALSGLVMLRCADKRNNFRS